MLIGEKLLKLTIEYQRAIEAREWESLGGKSVFRDTSVIVAEYETALKELLSS